MMFNIHDIRSRLRINKHRLDEELEIQADIQDRIGEAMANANTERDNAKRDLETTEAALIRDLKLRDDKLSNPIAEKEAKATHRYGQAWSAYTSARQNAEELAALYDAWQRRGYQLRALADLFVAQYFAINTAGGKGEPITYLEGRAKMREASTRKNTTDPPTLRRRPTT